MVYGLARDIFRKNNRGDLHFNSHKTRRVEHQAAGENTLRGPCAVIRAEEEHDTACVFIHAVSEQLCVSFILDERCIL